MHLVRAGRRVFNLEYMIAAEEREVAEGGGLVVTVEPGREIPLFGDDADEFRAALADAMYRPARGAGGSGAGVSIGRKVDPTSGDPLPRPPGRDRKRGR